MDDNNTQRLVSVTGVLLVVATVVWGLLGLSGGVGSSRPSEPASITFPSTGDQTISARLWQDPFEVWQDTTNGITVASGSPAQRTPIRQLSEQFVQDGRSILFLGVLLEGDPFPEDAEVRRRLRYAVELALLNSNSAPEDRSHVGLAVCKLEEKDTNSAAVPTPVVFESFSPSGHLRTSQIVVLWLRENDFAPNPQARFRQLSTNLSLGTCSNRTLCLIGPRSSDTLRAMALQSHSYSQQTRTPPIGHLKIYSPEATAPDSMLIEGLADTSERTDLIRCIRTNFGDNVEFKNWIALDNQLAKVLVQELGNRLRNGRSKKSSVNYLVVVSEGDTFYGRSFPTLISHEVALDRGSNNLLNAQLLFFRYLRGLEGIKPASIKEVKEAKLPSTLEETATAVLQKRSAASEERKAEGEAQKDYALRLSMMLKERDIALRLAGEGRIAAVGLAGNDVYDKLVLLRALRSQLPEAIFFTTDLDARLWSGREELAYTRNLLVASAYDTKPDPGEAHAPFRDVYQMAVYQACRGALHEYLAETSICPELEPKLFEIGRHGPVSLGTRGHQKGSAAGSWKGLLALTVTVPAVLFLLSAYLRGGFYRPDAKMLGGRALQDEGKMPWGALFLVFGFIIVTLCGIAAAYTIARYSDEEPWSLSDGISIWPTEIIRLLSVEFGVLVLILATFRLRDHVGSLGKEFFNQATMTPIALNSIWIGRWKPTKTGVKNKVDAWTLFAQFLYLGRQKHRFVRVVFSVLAYAAIVVLATWKIGTFPGRLCIRGEWSWWADTILLAGVVLLFLLILFYALDAAYLTNTLLRYLSNQYDSVHWPQDLTKQWANKKGICQDHLESWLAVRFAALKTRETGSFMAWPFVMLLFVLISRFQCFENWTWPPLLTCILSINFAMAAACWWLVRKAAHNVRKDAIEGLDKVSGEIQTSGGSAIQVDNTDWTEVPVETYLTRLKDLRKEIDDEKRGAFARWIQDPTLVALFLPTGVTGILSVFLYFILNR
jgi:hypothetical protein